MTQSENSESFKSIKKLFKDVSGGRSASVSKSRRSPEFSRISGVRWIQSKMRRLMSFMGKKRAASSYQAMHEDKIERRYDGPMPGTSEITSAPLPDQVDEKNTAAKKVQTKSKRIRKVLVKSCRYMGVGVSQMAPGIGGAFGGQVIPPPQYVDFYANGFHQTRYY